MHIDFNFEIMKLKSLRTTDVVHILEILKTLYNDNTIFHSIRVQHLALRLDFLWAHFPKIPKVLPGGFGVLRSPYHIWLLKRVSAQFFVIF